ncbi:peptide deformylase [Intrasporangium chromatireducens Q5-1]|uniref:Peptide deformylase n=1 Tax=Intrasporangium chromatireducens Q5-1 TaxID=584657 RepID=W9GKY4_9MICO|nr:peptide deformylase [Intrasporangium chromatireducens]EWT05483.1 peptide deformylase [Intrasporangium chromatireducens Q5-1]
MAVRPIVITGEPVLHRTAAHVTDFDDDLHRLVSDMHETNEAANGVGLAAPQIGVGLRVFVWKMENHDGVPPEGHIINPIVTTSRVPQERPDPHEDSEGCLSVPGESFPLKRAERAHVVGVDLDQKPVEFDATGWFARCMQHEYDHLNGTLYVDRLDDRYAKKARKAVKRNGWGGPGHTWLPGVDPDPFGHDAPAQVE